MTLLDVVLAWFKSTKVLLDSAGVTATHTQGDSSSPKPSCSLNLRHANREADLVLWTSGEAELGIMGADGAVIQEHVEILSVETLGVVLERMVRAVL